MFSNLKKKVSQRRQNASLSPPPTPKKNPDDVTEIAATASETSSSLGLPTLPNTSTTTAMKIHIQIKFRPAWNINDKILSCLQKRHIDILLHKSSPIDKEWHQNDLYGKVEVPKSDSMTQAQHMESIKREIQVAINQPEAIVTLKNWEPRRRRQKMQSTPAGVGNGLGLFGEPIHAKLPSTQQSKKKQPWTPAKLVLQDQDGNPIEYNIRLSPQSVQDLEGSGNMRDYHGMPVRHNSQPVCLLTAQVVKHDETMEGDVRTSAQNSNNAGMDLSHVDQYHRRLHGHVRKPSM